MKKLLTALLLNCATIATLCAESQHYSNELQHENSGCAVIGCKILLEKGDYITEKGNIFIKHEVQTEIFDSVKAWQLLEFKLFVYVECPNCHGLYLVDNGCTNPNCVKIR